jgi:UDP-glucose:(heptosyl)LPS alpha-1,3-glucosyltransferase
VKIALALERFDTGLGGQAIWTGGFAAHLHAAGHEVHVVSCAFGPHGLPVQTHGVAWSWSPLVRARRFSSVLRQLRPDVIHDAGVAVACGVWQPHTGSDLYSLDRLIATEPLTRRVRAAVSPKIRLLRLQMRLLESCLARRSSRIIAVSNLVGDLLRRRHPGARHKIDVIMNGTDTTHFRPREDCSPGSAGRRRRGDDDVLFLVVAHNPRLKGVDTVFHSLAVLAGQGLPVRLAVAGGADDAVWRGLAARLGIGELVTFLGRVDDMRPIYDAADALVHPTRWDACSLVVLEALACGLPVITTPVNGAAQAIEDGKSGLILKDAESPAELAHLMRLLLDPNRRATLSAAARLAAIRHDVRSNYRDVEGLLLGIAQFRDKEARNIARPGIESRC